MIIRWVQRSMPELMDILWSISRNLLQAYYMFSARMVNENSRKLPMKTHYGAETRIPVSAIGSRDSRPAGNVYISDSFVWNASASIGQTSIWKAGVTCFRLGDPVEVGTLTRSP